MASGKLVMNDLKLASDAVVMNGIAVASGRIVMNDTAMAKRKKSGVQAMSEAELQALIVDAARKLGYWVYHTHDSRNSESGMPDLLVMGYGRAFFWELKTEAAARKMRWLSEWTTPGRRHFMQLTVIAEMRRAGLRARIVRPRDWNSGWVEKQLLEGR